METNTNLPVPNPNLTKSVKWHKGIIAIVVLALLAAVVGYIALKNNGGSLAIFTPQNPKDLPQSHNAFGFNVIKSLSQEDKGNIFISPSSISLALSMVYNGASGQTKDTMAKTLQFQNLSVEAINQQSRDLVSLLKNPDPNIELSIANSVWSKQGIDFQSNFLQTVKSNFNAQIQSLDFNNPNSVNTINSWVSKNTNGKIPTIVNSISPDMVIYLINAVYFKGTWTTAFDKSLTRDKQFTPVSGVPEMKPLMEQGGKFQYLENDDFQSVSLPYGKNKRLSMYVFLPKNLSDFTNNLSIGKWNSWMQQYQNTEGTILLPRFKIEYEKQLKDLLTQLGMGVAFQDSADFSLMRPQKDIRISEVKHKTYIDVNEEGTEAAAVTSVGGQLSSIVANPPKTFYMEVNKPFFIAIRDNQTQEILFMGAIQQP